VQCRFFLQSRDFDSALLHSRKMMAAWDQAWISAAGSIDDEQPKHCVQGPGPRLSASEHSARIATVAPKPENFGESRAASSCSDAAPKMCKLQPE
jgi:hypothetical protein